MFLWCDYVLADELTSQERSSISPAWSAVLWASLGHGDNLQLRWDILWQGAAVTAKTLWPFRLVFIIQLLYRGDVLNWGDFKQVFKWRIFFFFNIWVATFSSHILNNEDCQICFVYIFMLNCLWRRLVVFFPSLLYYKANHHSSHCLRELSVCPLN